MALIFLRLFFSNHLNKDQLSLQYSVPLIFPSSNVKIYVCSIHQLVNDNLEVKFKNKYDVKQINLWCEKCVLIQF